jgi:hypothetical protein
VVLKERKKKRVAASVGYGVDLALLGCILAREKVCSFADE